MTLNLAMFAHQYSVSYLSLLSLEQGWMRLHNHTRFVALVCPFFRTWVNDYLYYMLKAQAIYILVQTPLHLLNLQIWKQFYTCKCSHFPNNSTQHIPCRYRSPARVRFIMEERKAHSRWSCCEASTGSHSSRTKGHVQMAQLGFSGVLYYRCNIAACWLHCPVGTTTSVAAFLPRYQF